MSLKCVDLLKIFQNEHFDQNKGCIDRRKNSLDRVFPDIAIFVDIVCLCVFLVLVIFAMIKLVMSFGGISITHERLVTHFFEISYCFEYHAIGP